jgi:peptidoglycan hydrolase CwlO-like protein
MSEWLQIASLVLNLVLGGTLIVTIATLKSTVKKAEAEAEKAKAEVEKMKAEVAQMKADYEKSVMKTFQEYIVEPLKVEIKRLNRNINGLQKAIKQANSCPHSDACPVLDELQKQSEHDPE